MTETFPSAPPVTLRDPTFDPERQMWTVHATDRKGRSGVVPVSAGMVDTYGSLSAAAASVLSVMLGDSDSAKGQTYQPGCSKGAGP